MKDQYNIGNRQNQNEWWHLSYGWKMNEIRSDNTQKSISRTEWRFILKMEINSRTRSTIQILWYWKNIYLLKKCNISMHTVGIFTWSRENMQIIITNHGHGFHFNKIEYFSCYFFFHSCSIHFILYGDVLIIGYLYWHCIDSASFNNGHIKWYWIRFRIGI